MKIIAVITSRLYLIFAEISGKFPEILNFRKIYNAIGETKTSLCADGVAMRCRNGTITSSSGTRRSTATWTFSTSRRRRSGCPTSYSTTSERCECSAFRRCVAPPSPPLHTRHILVTASISSPSLISPRISSAASSIFQSCTHFYRFPNGLLLFVFACTSIGLLAFCLFSNFCLFIWLLVSPIKLPKHGCRLRDYSFNRRKL